MYHYLKRNYYIQILIENSENIGILPPHIAQSISTETSGSTDNGLDSFEHGNYKKKKHRSGSLTRKPYCIYVYIKYFYILININSLYQLND